MIFLELAGGLALLLVCGDIFVRGAVGVAHWLKVSPLIIGLILVGFGTSLPELVASLEAARLGSPGIAVGNVVGSNIANILLILGLSALITPVAVAVGGFRFNAPVLAGVTLLAMVLFHLGEIGRVGGLCFVVLLLAYIFAAYWRERRYGAEPEMTRLGDEIEALPPRQASPWIYLAGVAAGLLGIVIGASLLISSAVALARQVGLSETVIGLTIVAVGTSLPELVTSVIAALRRHGDVALGNIIGSNIFNLLGILGVTAIYLPLTVPAEILRFDSWVMLAATALAIIFATTQAKLQRWEGAVLLLGYIAYTAALLSPGWRTSLEPAAL